MNASRYHPTLSRKLLATAARKARQAGVEVDDAHQQMEEIVLAHESDYDAGRGATRETFYLNKLDQWLIRQRSQMRFGTELDREADEGDYGAAQAAQFEIEQLREEDALTVDHGWRDLSDADVDARLQGFSQQNRRIAALIVRGKSAEEAAEALGLTARRVRQVVEEIVELFSAGSVPVQPTLF